MRHREFLKRQPLLSYSPGGKEHTVEDLKTALITITLKTTGFGFSFWNKWFLKKEIEDEIEPKLHALLERS